MISLFLVEDERIARESIRDNVPWQEHDILFLGMRRMEKSLCRSSWKNGRIFC